MPLLDPDRSATAPGDGTEPVSKSLVAKNIDLGICFGKTTHLHVLQVTVKTILASYCCSATPKFHVVALSQSEAMITSRLSICLRECLRDYTYSE
jgi:hypothetical protein